MLSECPWNVCHARLFTALEIPAEVGRSLAMLRGGLPGARWIDPENYHLTLRFIGDINDGLAREIAFMLGNVNRMSFELRLDGLTSFGGRRPRAVVAVAARTQQLFELQAEHERLMQRVGLEPEGRKYTPHVTLARLRDASSHDVADYLATRHPFSPGALPRLTFRAVFVARLGRRGTLCDRGRLSVGGVGEANRAWRIANCRSPTRHSPSAHFSRRPYQPHLGVEHGGRKAVAVGDELAKERQRRRMRRLDLAHDAAEIEAQLGLELARELLHARMPARHDMCTSLMPRLRAASSVRSSSAEPTPWLCHGFSMLKATSATPGEAVPNGLSSATPRRIPSTRKPCMTVPICIAVSA